MALTRSIYPPILSAYQPAFDMKSKFGCKVYFQISTLNSLKEIKHVQLTCNNLVTNQNALNRDKWKNKIRFYKLNEITYDSEKGMYYLYIANSDIASGFQNDSYKIQIRFGTIEYTNEDDKASWLTSNLDKFSEWSTVCIIKAIPKPEFAVVGFSDDPEQETIIQTSALTCIGQYYCEDASEVLQSFRFKILSSTGEEIEDSGIISCPVYAGTNDYVTYVDNRQVIQYDVRAILEEQSGYILECSYITKNYYENSGEYNFSVSQGEHIPLNVEFIIIPDEKNGRNKIHLTFLDNNAIDNVAIRKSSNKSNFKIWEDVKIFSINDVIDTYIDADYIIESGIWYRYGIQRINNRNERGPIYFGTYGYYEYDHDNRTLIKTEKKEIINNYRDCFLYGNSVQLKLEYNTKISTFQNTVLESKTDTIGSKYAFIRRNGNVFYKEFPLNSLITGICDDEDLFTSDSKMYGGDGPALLYSQMNDKLNTSIYYDYNFEREYRNVVYNFLYDGKNKLFKSPTEGNILVRLMNITFSPEETLGRLIYNLNCNAYEQGEVNTKSLREFGILSGEDFNTSQEAKKILSCIGQLQGEMYNGKDLIAAAKEKYEKVESGYTYTVDEITSVHIEAPPGTRFRINGQLIEVGITGIYEYSDSPITDLVVYDVSEDTLEDEVWSTSSIIVDFEFNMAIKEDDSKNFVTITNSKATGEFYQQFKAGDDVVKMIQDRYYDSQEDFLTEVYAIDFIRIEAYDQAIELPNGTVIYKKVHFIINDIEPPFIMNDSSVYELQRDIVDIKSVKFLDDTVAKVEYICKIKKGIY